MAIEEHLASLRQKHATLDRMIWNEEQRLWPDEQQIKRMKVNKLHLKEQIDRIQSHPGPIAAE